MWTSPAGKNAHCRDDHLIIGHAIAATCALAVSIRGARHGRSISASSLLRPRRYASALLTFKFGAPIPLGLAAAFRLRRRFGSVMALITARLRGDYLAIVTLAFSEVVRNRPPARDLADQRHRMASRAFPATWRGRISPQDSTLVYLAIVFAFPRRRGSFLQNAASPFGRVLRRHPRRRFRSPASRQMGDCLQGRGFRHQRRDLGLAGRSRHYTSYIAPDASCR